MLLAVILSFGATLVPHSLSSTTGRKLMAFSAGGRNALGESVRGRAE
jgi:hypothetical protein